MQLKMQTSLTLILGSVVSLIGWMFIYPDSGSMDATAAEEAAELMADPGLSKVGMLMGYGGMGAVFVGFLNISRKIASGDGAGAPYANISALLAVALFVLGTLVIGIEWGVTEAGSAATGTALMQISLATESTFTLSCGLLMLLLGIGIILDKNFHIVIGGLSVLSGALFLIGNINEELAIGGFIAWLGLMVVAVALGVQTLRSSDN
tara:strand:+ start:2843 stop:3463 length:621 start_codon:yes stop_codon:yes gene_type:complete